VHSVRIARRVEATPDEASTAPAELLLSPGRRRVLLICHLPRHLPRNLPPIGLDAPQLVCGRERETRGSGVEPEEGRACIDLFLQLVARSERHEVPRVALTRNGLPVAASLERASSILWESVRARGRVERRAQPVVEVTAHEEEVERGRRVERAPAPVAVRQPMRKDIRRVAVTLGELSAVALGYIFD